MYADGSKSLAKGRSLDMLLGSIGLHDRNSPVKSVPDVSNMFSYRAGTVTRSVAPFYIKAAMIFRSSGLARLSTGFDLLHRDPCIAT
jgi:hypothetical protein